MSDFEIGQVVWRVTEWGSVEKYRIASKPRKDDSVLVTRADSSHKYRRLFQIRELHTSKRAALEAHVKRCERKVASAEAELQQARTKLAECREEEQTCR